MTIIEIVFLVAAVIFIILVVNGLLSWNKRKPDVNRLLELYADGLNCMIKGQHRQALRFFKQITAADSGFVDVYIKSGRILREQGKVDSAVKIHSGLLYRQNLSKDEFVDIYSELVEDYLALNQYQKASEYASKLLQTDKHNQLALDRLHLIAKKQHRWDEAANYYRKMSSQGRKADSRQLAIYKVLEGVEKYTAGAYHEARLIFRKSIRIDPGCEAGYYYMAESYVIDHRGEDAIPWWEKFIEVAPEKASLIFGSVRKILFNLGSFGKMEQFYLGILAKQPNDLQTATALANFYERKGDLNRSIALMDDVMGKKGDDLVARATLCKLLIAQGKYQEAKELLGELVDAFQTRNLFICAHCGHNNPDIAWICPNCSETDTFYQP